jgi:glutamine amidotransferase
VITIVDYGVGNLMSIQNMLGKLGVGSRISAEPRELRTANKIILPGVGAFAHGMERLRAMGFEEPLGERVMNDGVPILGICLGMQLFSRRSDEGDVPGLGWLDADAVSFDRSRLQQHHRVPHMGWSEIDVTRPSRLFDEAPERRFYFVHSYHVACHDQSDVLAWSTHGYPFVAAVERNNIVGVQFHPEKSHRYGMALLRNFAERY